MPQLIRKFADAKVDLLKLRYNAATLTYLRTESFHLRIFLFTFRVNKLCFKHY